MLTQPTSDIKLPEEIQKAIENGRNQVTILEAETLRLQDLIKSLNYSITQLHNEKKDLEEKIPSLEGKFDILTEQVKDLENNYKIELDNLKETQDKIKEYNKTRINDSIDLELKKQVFNDEILKYLEKEKDYEKRNEELKQKEEKVNNKVSKLEEIIKCIHQD